MSYETDRRWADEYMRQVTAIVGPLLLVPAPFERDIVEATDLVVLRARDMTIAVRLRRDRYAKHYPRQFTIRSRRSNGVKTELSKIVDGWGDWLLHKPDNRASSGGVHNGFRLKTMAANYRRLRRSLPVLATSESPRRAQGPSCIR